MYRSDFNNVGVDEQGIVVGCCKHCGSNGVDIHTHQCTTTTKQPLPAINPDMDFWTMANDFAKSVLNPETEQLFTDYCTKFNLNNNEIQFLRLMTESAIAIPIMMASLKLRSK